MNDYLKFFKQENSKKERVTETAQEIWLVENGKRIKLIGKNVNTYQELISEGVKKE